MQIATAPNTKARATDTTLAEGLDAATLAANTYSLPQTVYRGPTSGGWWHTNALSPALQAAEVHCTILPVHYFI